MKSPAGRYLFSRFMAGPSRVSVEWELATVDPLLVARLDAKSLLRRAGRLVVAPYALGKRCHARSGPCNLERLSLQVDSLVASGCVELGAPNLVRALVLGPAEG